MTMMRKNPVNEQPFLIMHERKIPLPSAISATGLMKTYAGQPIPALDNVTLNIPRGSIFGLLGPNGAGKSTFINILAGLVVKDAGSVAIWDYDIESQTRLARSAIGVVPQEINYDPFFTPAELLELHAGLYGVPKSERRTLDILEALGLADKANAYTRTLSGGMKRRLLVAKALVHSPPILILDEPTAGVDVELRQNLWAYVRELHAQGTTIVLTTHYLEEAETLCDEIAIIDRGHLIACEPKEKLLSRLDCKKLTIHPSRELTSVDASLKPFDAELLPDGAVSLTYRPSKTPTASVLSAIRRAGIEIADITTQEADLEDVFLSLTSRKTNGKTVSIK